MNSQLRIAFLNSWILERGQGSGTAAGILGLAAGLRQLGHEVSILPPPERVPGMTLRRLLYNIQLALHPLQQDFHLIVGFDIDGFLVPCPPGSKYVVCLKGISAEEMRFESGWPRAYLGMLARFERRNTRRADQVIVPSEHSKRIAAEVYGLGSEKTVVVSEGIDLVEWDALHRTPPVRRDDRPTILSVARQYPRKNTRLLIDAMPAICAAVPEVRLRIVGGGPMLLSLKEQAVRLGVDKSVEFVGEVATDEAVRRKFFLADVFCLPTLQEGFGIVFLEAMAAGLPIVAARAAAVPEVVPDEEAGLLVSPHNSKELAAAVIRLLKDRDLASRLASAGKIRVRSYDWPKVANTFLKKMGLGKASMFGER